MVREVFGINFDGTYEKSNVILALADLISQDDHSEPIVALHQVGSNNVSELSISPEEKKKLSEKVQTGCVDDDTKEELSMISKDAIPNGHEIKDEHEVAAISSYPEEHLDVQVYHTRDYLQFDDTFCSSASLIALRALYNPYRDRLNKALKNGQQKNMGHTNFDYTSIKLGDSILQKEIGIVPQNRDEQKRLAQVLREIDYDTAKACKDAEAFVNVADDSIYLPTSSNEVSFDQKLVNVNEQFNK